LENHLVMLASAALQGLAAVQQDAPSVQQPVGPVLAVCPQQGPASWQHAAPTSQHFGAAEQQPAPWSQQGIPIAQHPDLLSARQQASPWMQQAIIFAQQSPGSCSAGLRFVNSKPSARAIPPKILVNMSYSNRQ
jgi:hypothetical protein